MRFSVAANPSRVPGPGQIAVRPYYVAVVVAFGKCGALIVLGFDVDQERVAKLPASKDKSNETVPNELRFARGLFMPGPNDIATSGTYVIAVPTPTAEAQRPNLAALTKPSKRQVPC